MSVRMKKLLASIAALAALAVGGSALAGAATSNGTSTTTTTTTAAQSSSTAQAPAPPANMPEHGTAAHEDAEKAVTGTAAATAQAAAVKSVGTTVEVHLDSSFNVHQGFGHGGPPPTA